MDFNSRDHDIWQQAFAKFSEDRESEAPSLPMNDCFEFFNGRNVDLVLDVGCGLGRWAIFLARRGFLVEGFDFSERAVSHARAWALREKIAAEFVVAPVTAIPFEGEIFDAAVAACVLDRLSRREMAMTIDALGLRIRRGGSLYALFDPYRPPDEAKAQGQEVPGSAATYIPYKDNELRSSFPGFHLLEFRSYPGGFRGLMLKRE